MAIVGKLTTKQGFERLELSIKLFAKGGYVRSVKELKLIKKELKTTKDLAILNSTYKVLQTTFIDEFNHIQPKYSGYRIQLSSFFKKRVNLTMKINVVGLNNKHTDRQWAKLIKQRSDTRIILQKLDDMLMRGHKTDLDKAIAVSYLYLSIIDGIYGKNLKDVIIWDLLSKINKIDMMKIHKMNLSDIIDYFKGMPKSKILFDGYNANIRNAVAHSSFTFNDKKKIITYEDRRKSRINKVSVDNMVDKIEKFGVLDELVLYYNQIGAVNKIINDLR